MCQILTVDIDVNDDDNNEKSLSQLARVDSMQFVGCQCYGKCQNNKYFCFKNKQTCENLCKHKSSRVCLNKIFKRDTNLRTRRK